MQMPCPKCGVETVVIKSFDERFGKLIHCKKSWGVKDGKVVGEEKYKEAGLAKKIRRSV